MATLAVPDKYPLLTSTWGNDFTLHADKSPILAYFTRRLMQRSNALHTDCQRDLRLARIWGFDPTKPSLVAPGAGGIHLERFRAVSTLDEKSAIRRSFDVPENAILVLNPRGVRRYVRNDVLIEAISIIVQRYPLAHFAFTGMKGERIIERLLERHGVQRFVTLLPRLGQADLARMYSVADIMVSLSNHDGTPNTMLEAMASGCFIVAGDIESIREWVQHGKNGLLCDPNSLESLVSQMSIAIDFEGLRVQAASLNRQIVEMRADYDRVMPRVEKFYLEIIEAHKVGGTL